MLAKKVKVTCTNGENFSLKLPKPATISSFYAFSMHKAGSSLLEKMLSEVCNKFSIPVINPHTQAWQSGISTGFIGPDLENALLPVGYAYLGFRHLFPLGMKTDLQTPNKLLLVRDPRDMLTSMYFSHKHSHTKPRKLGSARKLMSDNRNSATTKDINDFAIENAHHYANLFSGYKKHLLSQPNTKIYRYEDIIFDKEAWLISMMEFYDFFSHYPERKLLKQAKKISTNNDIHPIRENPNKHIRQVAPGNYTKHLSPDTVRVLNSELADFLNHFNYS